MLHAGTRLNDNNEVVTNGGRVLNVTAIANDLSHAVKICYDGIKSNNITFSGMQYRSDIAQR